MDLSTLSGDEVVYLAQCDEAVTRSWPRGVPRAPRYPHGEIAAGDYLRAWSREQPDATALIYYGRKITYMELDQLSERMAVLLHDRGTQVGDRVSIFMGNCPQFHIAFYALMKLGAIHVPTNPMFKASELLHQLQDTGARTIVTHHHLHPLVEAVRPDTSLADVFVTAPGEMLCSEPELPLPEGLYVESTPCAGATELLPALASMGDVDYRGPAIDLDAPAAINYTGGTTGLPKGCLHTQRDMLYTAACAVSQTLDMERNAVSVVYFPIFWASGQNARVSIPIFSGSSVVLLARWDTVAVMAAISRHGGTHTKMLVDNIVDLLAHPRRDEFTLRSLRCVHAVGFFKKLNAEIRRDWMRLTGSLLLEGGWGMTETQSHDSFVTGMQEGDIDLLRGPGFMGLPVPGTYFKIADPSTGARLPFGTEGEICIRSPVFKGYWNRSGPPDPVLRDGWFHSGDTGVMSSEGYLWYLGRHKDMLKVRGMSVYPGEIEAVLGQHPQVELCAVVGKPDETAGVNRPGFLN